MSRKKLLLIVVLAVLTTAVLLLSFFSQTQPEDNSFYEENPWTGSEDFVDPDQTEESYGIAKVSFRGGEQLEFLSSPTFAADVGQLVSDYVITKYPDERVVYVLEETITVSDNRYDFTIEGEATGIKLEATAYWTDQDYANLFIEDVGPINKFSRYYLPPEAPISE